MRCHFCANTCALTTGRRLQLPNDTAVEYQCLSYDDIVASLEAADGVCDVAAAGTPVTPDLCERGGKEESAPLGVGR